MAEMRVGRFQQRWPGRLDWIPSLSREREPRAEYVDQPGGEGRRVACGLTSVRHADDARVRVGLESRQHPYCLHVSSLKVLRDISLGTCAGVVGVTRAKGDFVTGFALDGTPQVQIDAHNTRFCDSGDGVLSRLWSFNDSRNNLSRHQCMCVCMYIGT